LDAQFLNFEFGSLVQVLEEFFNRNLPASSQSHLLSSSSSSNTQPSHVMEDGKWDPSEIEVGFICVAG